MPAPRSRHSANAYRSIGNNLSSSKSGRWERPRRTGPLFVGLQQQLTDRGVQLGKNHLAQAATLVGDEPQYLPEPHSASSCTCAIAQATTSPEAKILSAVN